MIVRYDPRYLADENRPTHLADAQALAERIQARAESTLHEYEHDLDFSVPDQVIIEIDCEIRLAGVYLLDVPAQTESEHLIKLRADYVRAWMLDSTANAPNATWKTLVDHELQHAIQFKARGLLLPEADQVAFAAQYLGADATNSESSAQLAQDLISDSDDAPEQHESYLTEVNRWFAKPSSITAGFDDKDSDDKDKDQSPLSYRVAAFLQYVGEQYGDGTKPEQRVADFLRRLYGLRSGTDAIRWAALNDPYVLLRDFYITALVHHAPDISQYPEYRILDEIDVHGGDAGSPPAYPELTIAGGQTQSLATAHFLGAHLDHGTGTVYKVQGLAGVDSVRVTLSRSLGAALTQGRVLLAFIPTGGDGSVLIDRQEMPRGPLGPGESWVVPVAGFSQFSIVVVATDGIVPNAGADYDLSVTDAGGTSAIDVLGPTTASPAQLETACPNTYIPVTVRPTVNGQFATGRTAAAFSAAIPGETVSVGAAWEGDDEYVLFLKTGAKPPVGTHPISVTFNGVSAPQTGQIDVIETATCSGDNEPVRVAALGTLGQGDSASTPVPITAGDASAAFGLDWLGSDFDLTLVAPSGRTISETTVASDVHVTEGASDVVISVDSPEAGTWTVQGSGVDVPDPEPVTNAVTEIGTAVRDEFAATAQGTAGNPIAVQLAATDDSEGLTGATVEATITDPSGVERHYPLFDDGGHADTRSSDGVYGTLAWATDIAGTYHVAVSLTATRADGSAVERHAETDVNLAAKVDTDGDGVADWSETFFGLDPADAADGAADFDGDALGLADELDAGLDPYSWDTDGGGESDASELIAGRDPRRPDDDHTFPVVLLGAAAQDGDLVSLSTATSDESGQIHLYRVSDTGRVDLGLEPGTLATFDDGPLTPGTYRYVAVAVAADGAVSAPVLSTSVTAAADVTPPFVRIIANDGVWSTTDREARITFSDLSEPVTDMRLADSEDALATATWIPYANPTTFTIGPTEGTHAVLAQVRDATGNVSNVASAVLQLDLTAPSSSVGAVPSSTNAPIDIPFSASDAGAGVRATELWARTRPTADDPWSEWALAGTSTTSPISYDFPAGDGEYELYTVATDQAGNHEDPPASADAAITFDATPPETAAGPLAASYTSPDVDVPFTASDDLTGLASVELWSRYRPTAADPWGAWTLGPSGTSSPITFTFGADGSYEFYTIGIDGASNREPAPGTADAATVKGSASVTTERVSEGAGGGQGDGASDDAFISADGRYVTFRSKATSLVAADTDPGDDVYLKDRLTGTISLVSATADGTPGSGLSQDPAISADGRYVTFRSQAANFVAGDTNGTAWDIFTKDLTTGAITRDSVSSSGTQANKASEHPVVSGDGRYVVYSSAATHLVAGDTNGVGDIFLRDRTAGTTIRISVSSSGSQADGASRAPAMSADGQTIVYESDATNLVAGDTNGVADIFRYDTTSGTTTRVSVASDGTQADGLSNKVAISADGSTIAYESEATNLVAGDTNGVRDVFRRVLATGTTSRVSVASDGTQGERRSADATLSADGTIVAFASDARHLVAGDTNNRNDIFLRDTTSGTTTRWSIATDGSQSDGTSENPWLTADGATVAFQSLATNLVADDTNGASDIFVRGVGLGP